MATQYIQDNDGSTFIAATRRPNGSWRKPRRVKEGFVPQEEVPLYESKGKKIAKENKANEGLPCGLTKEAWEKMKEAQAKLMNPPQKAAKKKNNKKKSNATNQTRVDQTDDNVVSNGVESQLSNNTTVASPAATGASSGVSKKKKSKSNNENNSTSVNQATGGSAAGNNSASVADDWVTMGKLKTTKKTVSSNAVDSATSGVENLRLDSKKSSKQSNKKRIDQLVVSKGVDELMNDMLVDEDHDDDNEEARAKEKNNEKQQLVKKIKTLRKKLKDVDTLKELSKQQTLDKEQKEKVSKADQFAKDLNKLQAKLDQINGGK